MLHLNEAGPDLQRGERRNREGKEKKGIKTNRSLKRKELNKIKKSKLKIKDG